MNGITINFPFLIIIVLVFIIIGVLVYRSIMKDDPNYKVKKGPKFCVKHGCKIMNEVYQGKTYWDEKTGKAYVGEYTRFVCPHNRHIIEIPGYMYPEKYIYMGRREVEVAPEC